MASLTETAYYTRKAINFGIIGLVAIIILKVAFGYLWELWLALNPPPPPPPTVAFGVLPDINFPESTSSATFAFSLETIDGKFPSLPPIGKVYFIPIAKENLQSNQRAMDIAGKMGFSSTPLDITKTLKQWTDVNNPLLTLRYNIATENFLLKYDWPNDTSIFNQKELSAEDAAKEEAKNYFNNLGILSKESQNAQSVVSYLRAAVGQYAPASSLSSADFVRLDYLQKDIDNLPILGDSPLRSPFYLIFSGTKENKRRIVEINYTVWNIDKENFATYPLRPLEEAWTDLQTGKGYIANTGTSGSNLAGVKKIYLAYYYPTRAMNFLEPIYVFEADKQFVAYVPALMKNWLKTGPDLPD